MGKERKHISRGRQKVEKVRVQRRLTAYETRVSEFNKLLERRDNWSGSGEGLARLEMEILTFAQQISATRH